MRGSAAELTRPVGFDVGAAITDVRELSEAVLPGAGLIRAFREIQRVREKSFSTRIEHELRVLGTFTSAMVEEALLELGRELTMEQLAEAGMEELVKEVVAQRFLPAFRDQYDRALQETAEVLRRGNVPITVRQIMERNILREGGKRLGLMDIPRQTKESVFKMLNAGRELGMNPRITAQWIEYMVPRGRFVKAGTKYRAQLIARTETLHAQRLSSLELYKNSPAVARVIAFDGDKDDECSARNGTEFSFEEAESEMNSTHPNCVLAFAPIASGDIP